MDPDFKDYPGTWYAFYQHCTCPLCVDSRRLFNEEAHDIWKSLENYKAANKQLASSLESRNRVVNELEAHAEALQYNVEELVIKNNNAEERAYRLEKQIETLLDVIARIMGA